MRGITTFLVMAGLLAIALLVGIPVMDELLPVATEYAAPKYSGTISNIHESVVKWSVLTFIVVSFTWAVLWILRTERQEVR